MSEVLPDADVDVGTLSEVVPMVPPGRLVVDREGVPVWTDDRTRSLFGLESDADPTVWGPVTIHVSDGGDETLRDRVFRQNGPVHDVTCRLAVGDERRRVSLDATPLTDGEGQVAYALLSFDGTTDDLDGTTDDLDGTTDDQSTAGDGTATGTDSGGADSSSRVARDRSRSGAGDAAAGGSRRVGSGRRAGGGGDVSLEPDPSSGGPVGTVGEVFERIDDAFFALDPDWRFTYVNDRTEVLLDRDRGQLLGESVWDCFPAAVDTTFQREFERAMETQEPVSFEEHFAPLDEWFEVRAYPSETGLSVYFCDVTERKERERKLERYRTAVEAAEEGIYIVDEDGYFTEVNDAYASMMGMSREELIGAHVSSVAEDEDVLAEAQRLEAELVAGERETASLEAEFTTDDDDTWVGEAVFAVIETDWGHERVGVVRDITERAERERELEARTHQGAAVANLGRRALEMDSLDDFLETAAETVADVLDTDYCEVLDLDAHADELHLRQGVGWHDGVVGEASVAASGDDSQAAYTLRSESPVVVENIDAETRFSGPDLLTDHDVTSGISTIVGPIEEPWGILGAHDTDQRPFSEHDVDFVRSVAHLLAATIDNRDRRAALENATEAFRAANAAVISDAPLEERTRELLDIGRTFLGLEVGFQTRIDDGVQTFECVSGDVSEIEEGGECSLEKAYCKTVMDREGLVAVHDAAAAGWTDDLAYETWGFDAYVGHVVTVDEESYGTIGFLSNEPRRDGFEPIERAFVEQLARWMSYALTRRRNEQELRASRRRYRTLIDNFPNGVVALFDKELRYNIVGGTTFDEMDQSAAEIEGEPIESAAPADVAGRLLRNFRATIEGERRTFAIANGGEVRRVQTVPIRDDEGEISSGMAISQEVTEQLVRERRLRQKREELDALNAINSLVQEVSETVVQQSDPETIRNTVQERLEASDSYARARLWEIGPDRESIVRSDDTDPEMASALDITSDTTEPHPVVRAARTGESQVERRLAGAASGPWAASDDEHSVLAAVPMTSEHAMYGILTIRTTRERAFGDAERAALTRLGTVVAHAIRSVHRESQLRRSEQLYRSLAENVPDGAVAMTDTDLRFQAVAGELLNELDFRQRDFRSRRPMEVNGLSEGPAERLESVLETVLEGEVVTDQIEYEDHVLDLQAIPVWDENDSEVAGTMTLARDITERVEQREQLEYERERLEFLIRLVRHNLLNSLNVVDGRLELMRGRVDPEVMNDLETAKERTEKMIDLVETIRSVTDAAARDSDRQLEPVAIADLLTDQVESTAVTFPDATVELESVPDVTVLGDDLLEEAIENLLHNAVQHNDGPTPEVRVEATADRETLTVSIADDGPGLPDHIRRQVDGDTVRDFDDLGSGFGLYIAQEVVDSYGGGITVEDSDLGGTVFHVTLPRADAGV
ncbi:MAG: PAS domain-containing protein [Haloglomus sp.]